MNSGGEFRRSLYPAVAGFAGLSLGIGLLRFAYSPMVPSLVEASALFCDRARELVPDFDPTPEDMAVIGSLCRDLDGIPLAIELAAGRVRAMSPAEIAEHLDQRFRLLRGGRRRVERNALPASSGR